MCVCVRARSLFAYVIEMESSPAAITPGQPVTSPYGKLSEPTEYDPIPHLGQPLKIPEFALSLTSPVSLDYQIGVPFRCAGDFVWPGVSPTTVPPVYTGGLLVNVPLQFTLKSLNVFLDKYGLKCFYPKIKVYSINENQKGTSLFRLHEEIEIASMAMRVSGPEITSPIWAYGQAMNTLPIDSEGFVIYRQIYAYMKIGKFWKPNLTYVVPTTPGEGSKFGGGLARRSNMPSAKPRFVIRGLTSELMRKGDESYWIKRGVSSVDTSNQGVVTNLRFTRMEVRESVLDGFIAHFDLFGKEIGLSAIGECVVLIENDAENETVRDLVPIVFPTTPKPQSTCFQPLPPPPPR